MEFRNHSQHQPMGLPSGSHGPVRWARPQSGVLWPARMLLRTATIAAIAAIAAIIASTAAIAAAAIAAAAAAVTNNATAGLTSTASGTQTIAIVGGVAGVVVVAALGYLVTRNMRKAPKSSVLESGVELELRQSRTTNFCDEGCRKQRAPLGQVLQSFIGRAHHCLSVCSTSSHRLWSSRRRRTLGASCLPQPRATWATRGPCASFSSLHPPTAPAPASDTHQPSLAPAAAARPMRSPTAFQPTPTSRAAGGQGSSARRSRRAPSGSASLLCPVKRHMRAASASRSVPAPDARRASSCNREPAGTRHLGSTSSNLIRSHTRGLNLRGPTHRRRLGRRRRRRARRRRHQARQTRRRRRQARQTRQARRRRRRQWCRLRPASTLR